MKPKKLTIAMLGLAPKGGPESASEDDGEGDGEAEKETEGGDEIPMGLTEAIGEFRSAFESGDDEEAAKAFHRALQCCDAC